MSPYPFVVVNSRAVGRAHAGHPWIFRSDIVSSQTNEPGFVTVVTSTQKFLGQALFSPNSQITLRFLTTKNEAIDSAFWKKRLEASFGRRTLSPKSAVRLIHGESDFIPSLIVDWYDSVLVFQTLSAGLEKAKNDLIRLFQDLLSPTCIIERNDPPVRDLEGLVRQKGVVSGVLPYELQIREGSHLFNVDPLEGQKTGLFLDQSENHVRAAHYTRGRVLDLFSYQGGFPVAVSDAAEEVIAVDSSAPALAALERNSQSNGKKNIRCVEANAFDFLREAQEQGEKFDTIILDPPPFMRKKKDKDAGLRGYKEINLRAMKLLKPEGVLMTFSCSQNFSSELFEKALLEASRDTKRPLQILEKRGAAVDHPVLVGFPESFYLQGYILRVL